MHKRVFSAAPAYEKRLPRSSTDEERPKAIHEPSKKCRLFEQREDKVEKVEKERAPFVLTSLPNGMSKALVISKRQYTIALVYCLLLSHRHDCLDLVDTRRLLYQPRSSDDNIFGLVSLETPRYSISSSI